MTHHGRHWKDLSGRQRTGVVAVSLAQVSLTIAAYRDLAKRPATEIEGGSKLPWAIAILVNWIGPLAYFAKGRRIASQ